MRRLAKRGSCRLYEDESGFWLETELDLDSTELSWEAKAALEKSRRVRSINFSFYELEEAVEGTDAFTEIKQLLEPVLVRLWKQGRLKCQRTA
jgi:hypothetical protein